ncbi:hypothetical protein ACQP2E_06160 [Actinoplanes sp. CA-015351]|uniref:hypothetical protein n=1 Tax=Actinoplanes sp. CA-015351 TaxID=3239897 RepID=UPI003D986D73
MTGTIGVVTVATTAWLAHKNLRVQHERALATERRALYGRFLGALREVEHCDIYITSTEEFDDEALTHEAVRAYRDACARASALLAEISIVAPACVEQVAAEYYDVVVLKRSPDSLARVRIALADAMREDVTA